MTRTRTFYPRQIQQLKWLANICAGEAWVRRGEKAKRYRITCQCHTCGGGDIVVTSGWAALGWIRDHSRHSTYMTAEEV